MSDVEELRTIALAALFAASHLALLVVGYLIRAVEDRARYQRARRIIRAHRRSRRPDPAGKHAAPADTPRTTGDTDE